MNINATSIEVPNTKNRVWTISHIWLTSFIAGPFGGCYLLSKNAKILGNVLLARKFLLIGFLSTTFLLLAPICLYLYLPPDVFDNVVERIPKTIFPVVYTSFIAIYAENHQKPQIKELLKTGYKKHSFFRLLFNILWMTLATVIYGFLLAFCVTFIQEFFQILVN